MKYLHRIFDVSVVLLLMALMLGGMAYVGGCASTDDPNAVLNTVSDVADIAEVSVILFTDPGPQQTQLLAEIDKAKQAADLPALRRIIARFRGTPATQPVK